jgi:4-hydroxy-3-polyprenylbenzoate decarboxylase
MNLDKTLDLLVKAGELKVIDTPLDINLEIPHVAYVEVKKSDSKALLFTNPIDKKTGKTFDVPVVMNLFGSFKRTQMLMGRDVEGIASEIEKFLHLKPPRSLGDKFHMVSDLFSLKSVFPKRSKWKGLAQEVVITGEDINLYDLPILTTWEEDGGPFITMGQVYTQSLDGELANVGMYRLQVYDKNHLGMHWQIHKDATHFFHEYKKAGKKMPVSIGIGGDPLYTWCGQAPLPHGINELLLYGFIKKEPVNLVQSVTNPIYVPHDVDYVIEGFVDPAIEVIEGPFGDHTGYYTLKEPYPVMEVSAITHKQNPKYVATVVGKPPLEDKYMGWATERIFLPLLKTTAPDLHDYHMPENGVFHNLILGSMTPHYKGHAKQFMHAFWGVGQMSFVKHAIFVNKEDAPDLTSYDALTRYILNRLSPKNVLISSGVIDALDHSSDEALVGGKLGVDCTGDEVEKQEFDITNNRLLLEAFQKINTTIKSVAQYYFDTANPIVFVGVEKEVSMKDLFVQIQPLYSYGRIFIFVDAKMNILSNLYMLLWRVVNNIDAGRDIFIDGDVFGIDGTNKSELDGFTREWPGDVLCTKEVLDTLNEKGVIDVDEQFIKDFGLL